MKLSEMVSAAGLEQSAAWHNEIELTKTPFAHQIEDLRLMGSYLSSGIYNEPGTGKTLPMQAYGLWVAGNGNKVIYVMPPILIEQFRESLYVNFPDIHRHINYATFNAGPKCRAELLYDWHHSGKYPDILIMSYVIFVKNYHIFQEAGYNCVIVDEATAVKNSHSLIHKAVKDFSSDGNGVVLVTGTPIETNLEDAYGLIKLITPEVYGSKKNFEWIHVDKTTIFVPSKGREEYRVVGYKMEKMLHENLFKQARRVLKSEVSDLPPRLITEYLVYLSPQHKKLYDSLIQERMIELGDEMIDMTSAQALYQAMQQALLNPEKFGEQVKQNTLLEALDEIVSELEGRKIVVYCWYNASVDLICERYKHLNPVKINGTVTGDKREQAKQSFINDESCKMVVANPKSGGVGIDGFQDVCSHVVYAEVCPFVGTFYQSVDRIHRRGQKAESVNVYVLVARETISVKLRNDLVKKDEMQEKVIQDKRSILADLMGGEGICGVLE